MKPGSSVLMESVKVSIVIPIYNVERYLERCLDSIATQSYPDLEVIMVDDGSTDGSAEIARRYEQKYAHFRLIQQENRFQGGARNTGIAAATGDYIAMPDSDDWVHPDYVRRLVETAIKYDADVVECNGVMVWESGARKNRRYHIDTERVIEEAGKTAYLKSSSFVVWNKLFRRTLIEHELFHEYMTKQDYAWTPIVVDKADRIVQIPDVLYYYLWRPGSATNRFKYNFDLKKAQEILESDKTFWERRKDVLRFLYVRNVMGDLIWPLSLEREHWPTVSLMMRSARDRYPDLEKELPALGCTRSMWGKMVLHDKLGCAYIYAHIYQFFLSTARKMMRIFRQI